MYVKISIVFPLWLTLLVPTLWSQSAILDQYVKTGLENNQALKTQNLSYLKSMEALKEARGLFMPQVTFSSSYTLAAGGRSIQFPVGDLLNPVYSTLNMLLENQTFPTDLENVDEQFLPHNFQETKVRVIQPLFNSDIYYNYQANKSLIKVQEASREAYRQELIKDIKTAYFNYLKAAELVKIYQETRTLLEEIIRVNQRLVEHHKATPDAISRAEYELAKIDQEAAYAEQQLQTAQAYVNFLINQPLETEIEIDTNLGTDQISHTLTDVSEMQANAVDSRWELTQLEYADQATQQNVQRNKFQFLPKAFLVLDGGFQGYGYDFGNQEFALGQVSLQWDLFNGLQKRAQYQQAKIDREILSQRKEQTTRQIQLQVRQNWYQLKAAEAVLKANHKGVKSAQTTFNLIHKKYINDQASLLELMDARTQLTQSKLSQVISNYDYLGKQAELEWAAGGN